MKDSAKFGGFKIDAFPVVFNDRVQWLATLVGMPSVHGKGASLEEAKLDLSNQWDKVAEAFRAAGEPVPKPPRPRGNRRALDMLRKLGARKSFPIY